MAALRAVNGCPWDRKQTHESLKPYLLEETYEVLETIDQRDTQKLKEELGDVLLQVLFHSQIAAEAESFTVEDVLDTLATKLIRRHPHVFGTSDQTSGVTSSEQVLSQWEQIKKAEREAAGTKQSALDGVPKTLPALLRAYQVQARAARVDSIGPTTARASSRSLPRSPKRWKNYVKRSLTRSNRPTRARHLFNQTDKNRLKRN